MIRLSAILACALGSVLPLAAADRPDLLRFSNGDQLHGHFEGLKNGSEVEWLRDDVAGKVAFKTSNIRHVVLNNGRPEKSLESLSNVTLVNGDRIPGKIAAMDATSVTVETSYAGALHIPRDQISMLAPSPLGGRLRYHGPFVADEWRMANASFPDGLPEPAPEADEGKEAEEPVTGDDPDADPKDVGRWKFSGSAWYSSAKGYGTALLRDDSMPERAILRFNVAWRNRLSLVVGFHADFAKPKPPEEEDNKAKAKAAARVRRAFVPGDSAILPVLFGNSYVLQILTSHVMLFRTRVDADGVPSIDRMPIVGQTVRLDESGEANVEIRSNRATGAISLFIDGDYVAQWNEPVGATDADAKETNKGAGFGFVVQSDDSPVRISDVLVAEWNGMPDSARSLESEDQDIVLLANGTDRFSGKVTGLADGKIRMDGKYGHFDFALDDVAEIRFARNGLAEASDPPDGSVVVRLGPIGQISGKPISGDSTSVRIASPVCGEINLTLESAVMLDFQQTSNFIDAWDDAF